MTDVDSDRDAATFEALRPRLIAVAYRMLGTLAEAEDVVGDVAERWMRSDREAVRVPEAWLMSVTSRRALDVLKSARMRRERYPGVWLPEPVATDDAPDVIADRDDTLTMGFLLLLERLTPLERAVFVLHDVMGHPHDEIAAMLDRSVVASRQALRRARVHVQVPRARREEDRAAARQVAERFLAAGAGGDLEEFLACLAPDVTVVSDGGGVVYASIRPVVGRQRAGRYLTNLSRRSGELFVVPMELNQSPGFVLCGDLGWIALLFDVDGDKITTIRAVVHPGKLERLVARLPGTDHLPSPWDRASRYRHRGGRPTGVDSVSHAAIDQTGP